MSSNFAGFSEEDLKRMKSGESGTNSTPQINTSNIKKLDKIGAKPKRPTHQYKLPILQKQDSDDNFDKIFDKCKLSIRTPTSPNAQINNNDFVDDNRNLSSSDDSLSNNNDSSVEETSNTEIKHEEVERKSSNATEASIENRRKSSNTTPDIVRCVDNYTEDDLAAHRAKLVELQLQQKIMEEQNKRRKEMLAKAIADRTKQTAEEVQRLEKIKKELQILDGQFSQDVAVLRKKIDQACLSYADAEKHYLKVEKEFLHAKIHLQKEKEKKELLTEHLCALITHNETRKAQKLETLMLELASDKKIDSQPATSEKVTNINDAITDDDDNPVIVDGVDQKTGKIVEFPPV